MDRFFLNIPLAEIMLLQKYIYFPLNIKHLEFQFLVHCAAAKDSSNDSKAIFFVSEFQRIVSSYNSGGRYYNTSASDKSRGTSVANSSKVFCVCVQKDSFSLFLYGGHQFRPFNSFSRNHYHIPSNQMLMHNDLIRTSFDN